MSKLSVTHLTVPHMRNESSGCTLNTESSVCVACHHSTCGRQCRNYLTQIQIEQNIKQIWPCLVNSWQRLGGFLTNCSWILMSFLKNGHNAWCLSEVIPLSWRTVQSGQRSFSWFQAKSQVFPGVTPQLLHLMQVMHTYTNTTRSQYSWHKEGSHCKKYYPWFTVR